MAIDIDWGNIEETILIWTCDTEWTAEDYYAAVRTSKELIESKPYTVDVMVDMQFNRMRPTMILQLAKFGYRNRCQNVDSVVLIYKNAFWLFLEETLQRIFSRDLNLMFAQDANEAYHLLAKQATI